MVTFFHQDRLRPHQNSFGFLQGPSAGSKAARWAARANSSSAPTTSLTTAPRATTEATVDACEDRGDSIIAAASAAPKLLQGHLEDLEWPVPEIAARGSAMEAWIARAAAESLEK